MVMDGSLNGWQKANGGVIKLKREKYINGRMDGGGRMNAEILCNHEGYGVEVE